MDDNLHKANVSSLAKIPVFIWSIFGFENSFPHLKTFLWSSETIQTKRYRKAL